MSGLLFIIKTSLDDFKRNKVRTLLTCLGILIGVSSVVLLTALGLGLKSYIKNEFANLGTNLVIVMPGKMFQGGSGGFNASGSALTGIRFDEKDVISIKKVKNLLYVVPAFIKTVSVSADGKTEIGTIYATTADIFPARNLEIEMGRIFDKNDLDKKSKNTVIGPKIAKKIFGLEVNAIGRYIKIDKQSFRVVGVLKPKGGGGFGGPDFDSFVYLPYKSAFSFNSDKTFYAINLKIAQETQIPEAKRDVKNILLKRYNDDEFSVVEQSEIQNAISSIISVLNLILVAIAAISLVVGGIGIMNIMYVSVIERVNEIGIRRAIGALNKDILYQFLAEAVILSLLGGLAGLGLSFMIILYIRSFFPAYLDFTSVILALFVSSGIGIIFGVFPARRAARLSPIEAIRYE